MTVFVAAALSIATISVPYVPQTDALCGGAAAAMVFRYWGDAHASVDQFGALVERRAGGVAGIAADVLTRAIADRGWRVDRVDPTLASLHGRIASGQPVVVLLADRRNLYHYVVVIGVTEEAIVVHDPSWGPSRAIKNSTFEALWSGAQHWSLVALPSEARAAVTTASADESVDQPSAVATDSCDPILNRAIDDVQARGLEHADAILATVREKCPASAGPYRELAGVRFAEKRWTDAASLAREALARQHDDAYAIDVLGSSLFMLDDAEGALRAWNRIGKPRLDLVRIEGIRHARYQTIAEALRLTPNTLLTPDAYVQARRRLDELPDRSSARLAVRPENDGFASVDVVIAERSGRPRGIAGWTGAAVRAGVDREASIALPGFTGQGELWTGAWRWWRNRPRVAIGFAVPRAGGLFGVWRVEGSWETETYADGGTIRRESRRHAGLAVSDWMTGNLRFSLNAGADLWDGGRRAASLGGSLERRWFGDRLSLGGDATSWIPLDNERAFQSAGAQLIVRSASNARGWVFEATTGAQRVSDAAPLSLWPGAGEGHARSTLLRAHPLLDDGIIDLAGGSSFGRTIQYANGEAQRWLAKPQLMRIGIATFVDVARASRRAADAPVTQVDVGAGLRVRVPGTNRVLRLDVAHGLRDGNSAFTVGFEY